VNRRQFLPAFAGLLVSAGIFAAESNPEPQPAPTFGDVAYGTHERQVLDFWQASFLLTPGIP
jgi:hypothetical protein